MRFGTVSAAALALVALAAPAQAQATHFGGRGELVISDDQPLGVISSTNVLTPLPPGSSSGISLEYGTLSNNGGSGTEFSISPGLDYFVADSFSSGAQLLVGVLNPAHGNAGGGNTDTILGIAPRIGYDFRIADSVTFWPKLYFGYATLSSSNNGGGYNSTSIGIFAPFLFHLASHFFIGIGPNVSTQLGENATQGNGSVAEPKLTELGVAATFGGWFLGD